MTKEKKKTMAPKVRFPEFREAGEWTFKNGNRVFVQISNKNHNSDLPVLAITQEHGAVPRDEINYTVIATDKSVENYKVVEVGDFIISLRSFQGGIEYSNYKGICSPAYIILRKSIDVEEHFFRHYFKTDLFIQDLNKNLEGIRDGKMVSYKQFSELLLPTPSKPEQQKIAATLTSLDDLISAQSEKIKALQAHKKGLMQQLFPAEGGRAPRVRFGEFEGSGDWEEKTLGECLLQKPDYGINAPAVPFSDNLPTYLRITDISEDGYFLRNQKVSVEKNVTEENYLEEGDIVLARTGASVGKSYKYRISDGRLVFAGFLIRVKPNLSIVDAELLFQFLSTEKYWNWVDFISARSGQPGINGTEYSSMPLTLPPSLKEQQKIASLLTSLDDLITTQHEKLEVLKAQKKGLMQQLFPNPNDEAI